MQCALLNINHKTTQLHLGLVVVVVPTYIPNHGRQSKTAACVSNSQSSDIQKEEEGEIITQHN